jgi:predicted secreted protein
MKITLISIVCVVLAVAGGLAVSALDGGEDEMPVFRMSEKDETCIQVAAGKPFAIRFGSSPGTGYGWVLAKEPDPELLKFIVEKVEEPKRGLLGGSETVFWNFRALASGETEIAMKYVRPWEKEAAPARTHMFKVRIMNREGE